MSFDEIKSRICDLEEIAAWPEALSLAGRVMARDSRSVWDYPGVVCTALGGDAATALPAAAAVLCSLVSIHLVDDMLDNDPQGDYHRLGAGRTANLALAFQAAGHRLLDAPTLPGNTRAALQATLARMALGTAFGQGLDAQEVTSEAGYWRVVEAKTPPLFGAAFRLGAILGGATDGVVDGLDRVGGVLGRLVQVSDDLSDSLSVPAKADWERRANNLSILFAMTAEHPEKARFLDLSTRVADPAALAAAQQILISCGAVSFCAFKMYEFFEQAESLLAGLEVPNTQPISEVLTAHMTPLHRLLASLGVEEPAALSIG